MRSSILRPWSKCPPYKAAPVPFRAAGACAASSQERQECNTQGQQAHRGHGGAVRVPRDQVREGAHPLPRRLPLPRAVLPVKAEGERHLVAAADGKVHLDDLHALDVQELVEDHAQEGLPLLAGVALGLGAEPAAGLPDRALVQVEGVAGRVGAALRVEDLLRDPGDPALAGRVVVPLDLVDAPLPRQLRHRAAEPPVLRVELVRLEVLLVVLLQVHHRHEVLLRPQRVAAEAEAGLLGPAQRLAVRVLEDDALALVHGLVRLVHLHAADLHHGTEVQADPGLAGVAALALGAPGRRRVVVEGGLRLVPDVDRARGHRIFVRLVELRAQAVRVELHLPQPPASLGARLADDAPLRRRVVVEAALVVAPALGALGAVAEVDGDGAAVVGGAALPAVEHGVVPLNPVLADAAVAHADLARARTEAELDGAAAAVVQVATLQQRVVQRRAPNAQPLHLRETLDEVSLLPDAAVLRFQDDAPALARRGLGLVDHGAGGRELLAFFASVQAEPCLPRHAARAGGDPRAGPAVGVVVEGEIGGVVAGERD
mmetsp:Transcript_19923/g.59711  ORF Transcript_19923/g.59711 Transcript_19923/m.59711 type:complete len:544 (-) Transcript_19923:1163-2794(-)